MAIEGVRLGPFIGGLNIASDPTSIGDTDVAVLENLELDLDGSLVSRPPIVAVGAQIPAGGSTTITKLLGYYTTPGGASYLIGHNGEKTYYYDGTSWSEIAAFPASDVTQYRDKLWVLAPHGHSESGGSWSPSDGFAAVSTMPKGSTIVAHKERLWIGLGPTAPENGSRLYYSDVGDPTGWPGGGHFLNVNAGDGQNIVGIYLYYNDLLIFKTRSTYRFSYSSAPDTGVVSKISETIGLASTDSAVAHDNSLYIVFTDKVYELVNYNFNQVNNKVPLVSDSYPTNMAYNVSISAWNDRLIVNYFGTCYVYSLRTSTWSTWKTSFPIGHVLSEPVTTLSQRPTAYVSNADAGDRNLYHVQEDLVPGRTEEMECTVVTKNYDYQSAHTFKRLSWWGVDTVNKAEIETLVTPIVHAPGVTWNDLADKTWADLGTWQRPLDITIEITDQVVSESSSGYRKFIKLLKSLRFRQVNFKVIFKITGSPETSPAKLFSITTFVGVKERVSQKVS